MSDQTVPSLTDRLAAYMVEAFLDGRGYDPGDKIDVEVTLKEGFHTVLTEMREDQAAGTATYDGIVPAPPPDRVPEGHTRIDGTIYRVVFEVRGQPMPDSGRFPLPVDLYRLVPSPPPGEPESEKP